MPVLRYFWGTKTGGFLIAISVLSTEHLSNSQVFDKCSKTCPYKCQGWGWHCSDAGSMSPKRIKQCHPSPHLRDVCSFLSSLFCLTHSNSFTAQNIVNTFISQQASWRKPKPNQIRGSGQTQNGMVRGNDGSDWIKYVDNSSRARQKVQVVPSGQHTLQWSGRYLPELGRERITKKIRIEANKLQEN